jgi:peptide/nickel transport system permease protein
MEEEKKRSEIAEEAAAQEETSVLQEENETEKLEAATMRTLSPARIVMKRFFRSKLSITGLVILITLFVLSFIGPLFQFLPFIWPEQKADNDNPVLQEFVTEQTVWLLNGSKIDAEGNPVTEETEGAVSQIVYIVTYSEPTIYLKPSGDHLLGTDSLGYDVFTRLMYGGRISLTVGFVVIILETLVGVLLGGLAGYFGKWVDQLIMRIVDIFQCVPTMPMLMIVGAALTESGMVGISKLYVLMAMLTLFGWASIARLVRGQILSLREQDFMLSAEASGLPVWRKIFKHLIPNVLPQLIVTMTLGLGGIILTEATLGFLGIGLPTQYATWGNMITAAANNFTLEHYPNLWIAPGVCIVLAVLGFNFVGDGLRDAFDPKSRR